MPTYLIMLLYYSKWEMLSSGNIPLVKTID